MVNIIGADRFNVVEDDEPYESFPLKLLKRATKNFNRANRIYDNEGIFYKGVLPDGMNITVKQIDEIVHDFTYKFNTYEFENEIKFPSTFRHPNLVRLLGHCTENNQRFLVYKYMENGSLSNALFGGNENLRKRLNWGTKVRICLGIAKGLAFLHHKDESKAMIVHRNIQPRSIFLDKCLHPKISYFGLAKHFGAGETHCDSVVRGKATGYTAPEYLTTGSVTEKIDVFSFGVSILVLSTEKKAYNYLGFVKIKTASLLNLAKGLHQKGDLLSLIDEDLMSSNSVKEATMLLELAILCTNYDPDLRPSMSEVVNILEGNTAMKIPPVDQLYVTTVSCEEVMSDIEGASSSSSYTKLTHDGFAYNPNNDWDGDADDATFSYQVASKVNEENTPEFHDDFFSNLKAFLSEGGEENNKVEYAKPSMGTLEPYEAATFSLRYIEVATRNFSPANKIGQGTSGTVYKGMLPNGKMVAVKNLSLKSDQGKVEFLNEVNTISTLRHPNIIRLLGHCTENNQHLLVHEYMENGCLNSALYKM